MPADYSTISELAKWLEHHVRDYCHAKMLIEKALAEVNNFSAEEKEALQHRRERLKRLENFQKERKTD